MKTTGKRKGYKVFGAIDYFTGRFFYHASSERFTSATYQAYLLTILAQTDQPIIVIHDGAKYHTSKDLQTFLAQQSRLTVFQLPSYSPNLNLIEDRPTDCTGRPRQPQQHSNHPSFSSFGGSDRRSQTILSTKGGPPLLGHCLARWHAGFSA